jgi:hypothetical protein
MLLIQLAMAANIMEESPKLKALKEVLEEIGNEKSAEPMNILITANDDRTCSQIKHVSKCSVRPCFLLYRSI